MADLKDCPLCGRAGTAIKPIPFCHSVSQVECPTCGAYAMDVVTASAVTEEPWREQRYRMSAVAREASLRGRRLLLHCQEGQVHVPGFDSLSIKEVVESRFPRSLNERFDRALLNLATLSKHFGDKLDPPDELGLSWLFSENDAEVRFTIAALMERGYLSGSIEHAGFIVELTPAGWNRVEELRAGRAGEQLTQAFVAMWFGNDRDRVGDCSSANSPRTHS